MVAAAVAETIHQATRSKDEKTVTSSSPPFPLFSFILQPSPTPQTMTELVCLADSLGVAWEVSAALNTPTTVLLPAENSASLIAHLKSSSIAVIDTESRLCTPADAVANTKLVCDIVGTQKPKVLFKTFDARHTQSAASELIEMMMSLDLSVCLLAPALPSCGQTTVGGFQLLDGVSIVLLYLYH